MMTQCKRTPAVGVLLTNHPPEFIAAGFRIHIIALKCSHLPSSLVPAENGITSRRIRLTSRHSMPSRWHWGRPPSSMHSSLFLTHFFTLQKFAPETLPTYLMTAHASTTSVWIFNLKSTLYTEEGKKKKKKKRAHYISSRKDHPLKYRYTNLTNSRVNAYKFAFCPRAMAIWNHLPGEAVLHITPSRAMLFQSSRNSLLCHVSARLPHPVVPPALCCF